MIIRAWRITKAKHAATAFTGGGAKAFGGRWNSPGTSIIYTAGSASLAILEMLVHLQTRELMRRYVIFEVTFHQSLMTRIHEDALPKPWRRSPAAASVQQVGNNWIAVGSSAVLEVPSALVPTECNYLLNPAHRDFAKITIGPRQPIKFDRRLVKTLAL